MDQVKVLSLKTVNLWKNYKKRVPSRSSAGDVRRIRQDQNFKFTVNSRDLWIWFSMIIKDD